MNEGGTLSSEVGASKAGAEMLHASPLVSPPTCSWRPNEGNCFAAFLSHYKVEAGSDARYLKDLLGRMLGCAVFLDSNELSDLRRLFADGVRKSDTVILLATAGVLTRPWYVCRHAQSMREKYRPLPLFLRILTATRNCPNAKVLARTMGERQAVDSCHRRGG